ncbi:MAG: amidohydrolase family protein [Oscillospiraceae bacterium]|nr:amidohydrolase family protein [Oscillospiraceae bacterium]
MTNSIFALLGDIIHTPKAGEVEIHYGSYLVCRAGRVAGIYPRLPEWFENEEVIDCTGKLIIPGMVDMHLHAAQYGARGFGMDLEQNEWLHNFAYPEEYCFEFPEYAEKMYTSFADELLHSTTTRACIYGSVHTDATVTLMKKLEQRGLRAYVGKVNMDRNAPEYYSETLDGSVEETLRWLELSNEFKKVKPILTPKCIFNVSDALMEQLGKIRDSHYLPVQSCLSETKGELEQRGELCPDCNTGAEAYSRFGMLGGAGGCVMAHCVHSDENELEALSRAGAYIAHCPASNLNLSAGIAPAARCLRDNMHIGLGTDLAAGESLNLCTAITAAVKVSKMHALTVDTETKPLSLVEALYMATKGGGEFFGQVGSFEPGYDFDALVIDDSPIAGNGRCTLLQRLERFIYLSDGKVEAKFIKGDKVL